MRVDVALYFQLNSSSIDFAIISKNRRLFETEYVQIIFYIYSLFLIYFFSLLTSPLLFQLLIFPPKNIACTRLMSSLYISVIVEIVIDLHIMGLRQA